ncbi:MAG: diguanylate cyclase [Thermodesulfobacterium sp.]|nr:diguanylate cyclase [Thermodesulfobacterium sp.]
MSKILLVDDDKIVLKVLSKLISKKIRLSTEQAKSFKELKSLLSRNSFLLAICDYHLPDAEHGEAIDFLIENKVPTIVLTASYDERIREKILEKNVIDYLVKGIPNIAEHIIYTISRALRNRKSKVLVIDDSKTDRTLMKKILEDMLFQVFEAGKGSEALEILEKNPDIKLIVLDYFLPEEDTVELIYSIREKFRKEEVGIVVVSGIIKTNMIPILLKAGANDFISKPFSKEEFMVRINNTIEMLNIIQELEFYAFRDPLTGLRNRRYFFEEAPKLWKNAQRSKSNLACIVIDIDDFKKINDSYGHDIGDEVLKDFAKHLRSFFRRKNDLIARTGGEEFTLLIGYEDKERLLEYLERFRKYIEENVLRVFKNSEELDVKYTISMGVELELKDSLKEMLISSDRKLYESKNKGKNCITF